MATKTKIITQARIFNVLDKIRKRFENSPIAHEVTTNIQNPYTTQQQDLDKAYEKLCDIFYRRTRKVADIQVRSNVSGIVWETAHPNNAFVFPTFHPLLGITPSDMRLLQEFKPIVIEYAIKQVRARNLNFFRLNSENTFVSLNNPEQIWVLSSWYEWATLSIEQTTTGCEIHLILGKGVKETAEDTIWFFAGDRSFF
jgi:hypothetical protein